MSREDLEKLSLQEQELLAKLAQLRQEKERLAEQERLREEQERLRKEMEKEVEIVLLSTSGSQLVVGSAPYREDVVQLFKNTPGRSWRGYTDDGKGKNLIPMAGWPDVEKRLLARPNITIKWETGVKEEMDWYLNAPPWEVDLHPSQRHFLAKMGPRQTNYYILTHIPGTDWDHDSRSAKLPRSEGWRLFEALKNVEGVVYSERAQAIIFEQVETRAKIDTIAKKEDSDHPILERLTHPVYMPKLDKEIPFKDALMPFQRVGVEFMYVTGGRTLLADVTGLGKTWQFLAYAEVMRWENPEFQSLAVVKAANLPNWIREIRRLTGEEPVVCKGGMPEYFTIKAITQDRAPYILISHDTLGTRRVVEGEDGREEEMYLWVNIFKGVQPNLIGIDEAHLIKSPTTYRSKAARALAKLPHVIPMTASPVLNRTEELWPLLYILDPEVFKVHDQFINTYTWNGRRPRNVDQLHELMRPMFLRRLRKDVQKDLPPINRITRFHDLSDRANKLYEKVLMGVYEELEHFDPIGKGGQEMSVVSILAQITRLKQVCAADKVEYTADLATSLVDEQNGNGNGGKVLIFSQFKGTALSIAQRLGSEAACTVRRTPTGFHSLDAIQRDQLFEDARHDPSVKFIVTTEAAKEGHNLEFCNWVIFNDLFWTPAGHDQCEGRAYGRLANPHTIDSFYVVAEVDIERWIMELLDKKIAIIQEAVENIESTRDVSGSIAMELIKKMKNEMWRRK